MTPMLRDRWLAWTLLGGLLLRCAAVPLAHQIGYTSDEKEYVHLAGRLIDGEGFVDSNGTVSVRAPLYPLILAGVMRLEGGGVALAHLLNVLCGTATIGLLYALAMELKLGVDTARWGAILTAVTPGLVIYSALLQTEAVAIPFFLAALIAGVRFLNRPAWQTGAWIGFWTGCAALTRAVFLPFGVLLLLLLCAVGGEGRNRRLAGVATALLLLLVTLLPWGIRNYEIHGELIPVSTYGGTALLIGNNPYADGTPKLSEEYAGWFAGEVELRRGVPPEELTEADRSEVSGEIALEYIREHPGESLLLALRKAQVLCLYPVTNTASILPFQLGVAGIEFLLALLAAAGIAVGASRWNRLLVVVLLFLLLHIALHGDARYRLPVTPLIALFAGGGIVALRGIAAGGLRLSRAAAWRGGALAAAVVVAYGITGWMLFNGKIS